MNDRASKEVMDVAEPSQPKPPMNWPRAFIELVGTLLALFLGVTWLLGFVFAKGGWPTFWCWFPFYAWYVDLEHMCQLLHWI